MEELIQILDYLKKHHSEVDLADLYATEEGKRATLSVIKEFSGFGYDPAHRFFTRKIGDIQFATENVELEDIHSPLDLLRAVLYLRDAHERRREAYVQKKGMSAPLPEHLYEAPGSLHKISRRDINAFLRESYGIENEKDLFALDGAKHREVIHALYRRYTGHVPLKDGTGGLIYSVPGKGEIKLRYGNLPDFEGNTSLFSHIRDMRRIVRETQRMTDRETLERVEQLGRIGEAREEGMDREIRD